MSFLYERCDDEFEEVDQNLDMTMWPYNPGEFRLPNIDRELNILEQYIAQTE